jgi:Flp pilus assembly protein TadG
MFLYFRQMISNRKGAATIEFVLILPMIVMLSLVVWQMAIAGMAVMDTKSALSDAVRVAAVTGDKEKAKEQALNSFGVSKDYRIKQFDIEFEEDKVIAKAKTQIDVLFMDSSPFEITRKAEAPLID